MPLGSSELGTHPRRHWLHSQSKPGGGGVAPATAHEPGVQLPKNGQSQTPSDRGRRPGSSLTERWKRLGWGTQRIHTLAWRPFPPQPSIFSSLPLPSTFPISRHLQGGGRGVCVAQGRALKGGARGTCQFPCSCCKGQEQMLGPAAGPSPLLYILPCRLLGSKHPSHRYRDLG